MEGKRFDQFARAVATSGSRRRVLAGFLAAALASLRVRTTSADDDGTAIADASGGDHNVATVVDPATGANDRDHTNDPCAKAGELRKEGKPCCNDLVKDDDDRCVRPQSSDGSHNGGNREGESDSGDGDGPSGAPAGCDSSTCPSDQSTNSTGPGRCCDDGFCSCGGECCGGPDCWVVRTDLPSAPGSDEPLSTFEELCTPPEGCIPCPRSGESCCSACVNDECASSGPIRGGSIRRR
jgi:hypothetical protein